MFFSKTEKAQRSHPFTPRRSGHTPSLLRCGGYTCCAAVRGQLPCIPARAPCTSVGQSFVRPSSYLGRSLSFLLCGNKQSREVLSGRCAMALWPFFYRGYEGCSFGWGYEGVVHATAIASATIFSFARRTRQQAIARWNAIVKRVVRSFFSKHGQAWQQASLGGASHTCACDCRKS